MQHSREHSGNLVATSCTCKMWHLSYLGMCIVSMVLTSNIIVVYSLNFPVSISFLYIFKHYITFVTHSWLFSVQGRRFSYTWNWVPWKNIEYFAALCRKMWPASWIPVSVFTGWWYRLRPWFCNAWHSWGKFPTHREVWKPANYIACNACLKINVVSALFYCAGVINVALFWVITQYILVVCYHLLENTLPSWWRC